jgi:chemotaxis methyl-accepting protein methylase
MKRYYIQTLSRKLLYKGGFEFTDNVKDAVSFNTIGEAMRQCSIVNKKFDMIICRVI